MRRPAAQACAEEALSTFSWLSCYLFPSITNLAYKEDNNGHSSVMSIIPGKPVHPWSCMSLRFKEALRALWAPSKSPCTLPQLHSLTLHPSVLFPILLEREWKEGRHRWWRPYNPKQGWHLWKKRGKEGGLSRRASDYRVTFRKSWLGQLGGPEQEESCLWQQWPISSTPPLLSVLGIAQKDCGIGMNRAWIAKVRQLEALS